jgi:hypothetical protein
MGIRTRSKGLKGPKGRKAGEWQFQISGSQISNLPVRQVFSAPLRIGRIETILCVETVVHMTKNNAVNLGVWVGLVVLTAVGMTAMNSSSVRLGGTMKSTEGSIIGYVPGEKPSYRYSYSVNGRPFQGSAETTERIENMKLGGAVTVFYEEENPGNSTVVAPGTAVVKRVPLIVATCAVIPLLLMWILHARRLLPPWGLFECCQEWVALRFAGRKGVAQPGN